MLADIRGVEAEIESGYLVPGCTLARADPHLVIRWTKEPAR
ncbi:MAG: hypothetical protein ACRDD1_17960 [Planctomycetia bacterium]